MNKSTARLQGLIRWRVKHVIREEAPRIDSGWKAFVAILGTITSTATFALAPDYTGIGEIVRAVILFGYVCIALVVTLKVAARVGKKWAVISVVIFVIVIPAAFQINEYLSGLDRAKVMARVSEKINKLCESNQRSKKVDEAPLVGKLYFPRFNVDSLQEHFMNSLRGSLIAALTQYEKNANIKEGLLARENMYGRPEENPNYRVVFSTKILDSDNTHWLEVFETTMEILNPLNAKPIASRTYYASAGWNQFNCVVSDDDVKFLISAITPAKNGVAQK